MGRHGTTSKFPPQQPAQAGSIHLSKEEPTRKQAAKWQAAVHHYTFIMSHQEVGVKSKEGANVSELRSPIINTSEPISSGGNEVILTAGKGILNWVHRGEPGAVEPRWFCSR